MESEEELDSAFTFLYPLPQQPLIYYPEMATNPVFIPNLIQLLSHENTDITLHVITALYEMTDEDVGDDMIEAEEDEARKEEIGSRVRRVVGDLINVLVSVFLEFAQSRRQSY